MKYGKFLEKGGTIGFVAPSFGCNIEPYRTAFDNAQNKFKQLGYKLCIGNNCYEGSGIGISNTPEKCGEELTENYCSAQSDVLISCGGGELMCEILEYVNFDKIKSAKPKWFLGYSDNTNMTFLLTTLCDTASIYGPCAPAFGMEPWHPAIEDAYRVMTGEKLVMHDYDKWERESIKNEQNPLLPYNVTENSVVKKISGDVDDLQSVLSSSENSEISFSGRLLGGCMDCLVNLTGTKYDKVSEFNKRYSKDGIIWFLESCDLNIMSIRRAIWQMENAGWFENVKGFIIGRPLVFGQEMFGLDQYSAVYGLLKKYNVPIIMDADIGHLAPMMPVICGSYGDVTVKGNNISGNEIELSMSCI